MASNHRQSDGAGGGRHGGGGNPSGRGGAPEWADGLKQLYDSVVEEDLPDSFKDLLSRLDAIDPERGKAKTPPSADGRETSQ